MGEGRVISLGKWTKRPYQDCKRANNNSCGKITEVKETLLCQEKPWGGQRDRDIAPGQFSSLSLQGIMKG